MFGLSDRLYSASMLNLFKPHARRNAANLAYGYLLIASVFLALIPTLWSALDLQLAKLFFSGAPSGAQAWWWVQILNRYTPTVFRVLLVLCLLLWLASKFHARWAHWRVPLAFIVLAGIAGPGIAVNGIVKPLWERARPSQIQQFGGAHQFSQAGVLAEECDKDCSFVSGHTACGFFLCSLALVFRKRRIVWMALGVLAGAAIGFARISSMAHWLSDVLWAFPVTLLSSWAVWWVILRDSTASGPMGQPDLSLKKEAPRLI
jgi:lipid A 4'-phosphatase